MEALLFISVSCLKLDGLRRHTLAVQSISSNNEVKGNTAQLISKAWKSNDKRLC